MTKQSIGQISGNKNQEIISRLANAPFSLRQRKGRYSARACFTIEGRQVEKEKSLGFNLDLDKLLSLWQVTEKIKAGALPITAFDGDAKEKEVQSDNIQPLSIGEAIALFKKDFWSARSVDNPKARTTWRGYEEVLKKIPLSGSIVSVELLKELVINNSHAETRTREKWVMVCNRLGKIAGIDTEPVRALKGSNRTLQNRYVPDDSEIEVVRESIADPGWRWIFGILAAYGLRPSELFYLDFNNIDRGILRVGAETKTGKRIVYPIHKRWLMNWQLIKINYPRSLEKTIGNYQLTNQEKGGKISRKFKSLNLKFTPYGLRDAYAIRGAILNISPSIVSQWMGHSLNVHYSAYQRYLSEREWSQVWDRLD